MIKKIFAVICMFFFVGTYLPAREQERSVNLTVGIDDNSQIHPGGPKTPILVPTVTLDGYTLFIDGNHADYTLELIDENDTVVYSTFVPSTVSVVVLPSTLSGNYELRLYPGGSYYFYGYISL